MYIIEYVTNIYNVYNIRFRYVCTTELTLYIKYIFNAFTGHGFSCCPLTYGSASLYTTVTIYTVYLMDSCMYNNVAMF